MNLPKYSQIQSTFIRGWERILSFVALGLICIFFILSLSNEVISKVEALSVAGIDNITWNVSQAEVDVFKLLIAVQSVPTSDDEGLAEVRKRFDIFYSRFAMITSGARNVQILKLLPRPEPVAKISAFLQWMLPLVDGPDEDLRQAIPVALGKIEDVQSDMRTLALETVASHALLSVERRNNVKETFIYIASMMVGLVLTVLFMFLLLARLYRFSNMLINRNSNIVIIQNKKWKISSCSDAWIKQMGYSRGETVGRDLIEFMHPDDAETSVALRNGLLTRVTGNEIVKNTRRFRTKSGKERIIELQSFVDKNGKRFQNIVTLNDVTELMRTQHQLQILVSHDELTGLYSRRGVKERLGDGTRTKDAGVYILDLDHFKSVNDSYGHEAGDALLSAMGQTMTRLTETGGCAARLGGEEFAIVRPWQGWAEAKEFGEALRLALEQTVVVDGARPISRTASIGIAKLDTSEALSDAMRLADDFAREAKTRGRNMVCAGEEKELHALALRGTFITAEEVQLALEAGEFYYAVQPIWNVGDRRIEGFEALIRWQKADGTVLSPLQFVNVFDEVTREPAFAALNTAMRKDVLAKLSDFPEAYVSFNYALERLSYVGASEELMGVYEVAKDSADRVIMIELSEMAFSQRGDLDILRVELKTLGENGFVIALDDFGIESSNLNRLQELPIQVVKLDKTLIDDLTTSERVRSIVRGIGSIVRSLNMKVIVEGVETTQQAEVLMDHNLYVHQGYLHAKPMRPEEVMGQLSKIGADVVTGESAEKVRDILQPHRS